MGAPNVVSPPATDKVSERRAEASKLLAVGVATLSSVAALVGARSGGIGRILANSPLLFACSVVCAAVSVVLAIVSITAVAHGSWYWLAGTCVLLLVASAVLMVVAENESAKKYERPSLSVEVGTDSLKVSAEIPLLRADEAMTVVVAGFDTASAESPVQSGLIGVELFRSTTGPAADGTAKVSSAIPRPSSSFKTIEVRAYRGPNDPGCIKVVDFNRPGACVLVPLAAP